MLQDGPAGDMKAMEPVFHGGLPAVLWKNIFQAYGVKGAIDLAAGEGEVCKAAMLLRKPCVHFASPIYMCGYCLITSSVGCLLTWPSRIILTRTPLTRASKLAKQQLQLLPLLLNRCRRRLPQRTVARKMGRNLRRGRVTIAAIKRRRRGEGRTQRPTRRLVTEHSL
jgi:hypothetical protein